MSLLKRTDFEKRITSLDEDIKDLYQAIHYVNEARNLLTSESVSKDITETLTISIQKEIDQLENKKR